MQKSPPKYLDKEASAFYRRHYDGCVANGSLTEDTYDSFCLVCRVWSLISQTDPTIDSKLAMRFNGLLKHLVAMSRPFGLLGSKGPPAKPKHSLADIIEKVTNAEEDEEGDTAEE